MKFTNENMYDHMDEVKSSIFKEDLAWLSGTGTGTCHAYNYFVYENICLLLDQFLQKIVPYFITEWK